jgi:ribosomal protein S18 acetylase RimI-like enzyme
MTVELRRADADDVPAITALVSAAYSVYIERMGRRPKPMVADYEAVVAGRETWVAVEEGAVVGVLVLEPEPDSLLVENVAVAPHAQGRGVGRLLLDHAEQRAREHGAGDLRLYTHLTMTENVAMYRGRGFVDDERCADDGTARVFLRKSV